MKKKLGGQPGNRGGKGGSRKAPEMKKFYEMLDKACLHAVDYLREVVDEAKRRGLEDAAWRKDGITAAGKLILKAPERVGNPDGSNISGPVVYLPKRHDDVETT